MIIICYRCPYCKITNIFTSDSKTDTEATCPCCGQKITLPFSKSDLQFNGYWRGLCPKCQNHIATYIMTRDNKDFGFCGECRELFPINDGQTFERRDRDGKDITRKEDKEREARWMVKYG